MKYRMLFIVGIIACFYTACKNDPPFDSAAQAAIDETTIQAYLKANSIQAVRGDSGLYYQVAKAGTGDHLLIDSDTLYVHFTGKLTDGTVFDSTAVNYVDTVSKSLLTRFVFSEALPGWRLGLHKIQQGGEIRLIVPSALGFQNHPAGTILGSSPALAIPANSVLDYYIKLISISPAKSK